MNWLNNLKVSKRLMLLISVLLLALLVTGGTGYYFLNKTNDAMNRMYNEKLIAIELMQENRIHARRIEVNIFGLMLTTNASENKSLLEEINQRVKLFDENLTKFEQMPIDEKQKMEVKEIREILGQYREVRGRAIELAAQNKNAEAYTLYSQQGKSLSEQFTKKLINLSEEVKKSAEDMNSKNQKEYVLAINLFIIIILSSIGLGVVLGSLISKRIIKRLNDIVSFLEVVSKGDFSKEISAASLKDKSEFGDVSRAVEVMNKNIKELIRHLSGISEQLAASSEELTASAEQSAQASNQVAGSVTEVAQGAEKQLQLTNNANNVVQQISKAIHQVSVNTETVTVSASKTATTANSGEEAISRAVNQMNIIKQKTNGAAEVFSELEDKSKQIGQIVDVISSISGQTNLLALNAAIEAARAGDAGRGFAVVAEEVRKLAEQSQEAAKQITSLIHEVQDKTNNAVAFVVDSKAEADRGTNVVTDAGHSFEEIVTMVKEMTVQIHEISAAIQEITSGAQHVVSAVNEIDNESKNAAEKTQTISAATEEQSASVEEIASASQHLAKMAEDLQQSIRRFKI